MTQALYWSENPHPVDGYTMFNYFSFRDGTLAIGQCEAVKTEEVMLARAALEQAGWRPGSYKYVNGKAMLD